MTITLADQYYLKAFEEYGYSYQEAIENLNYALSYNPGHSGANYLMGRFYMEEFKKYDEAESYLLKALQKDPENIEACKTYIRLLIDIENYQEALRIITYAKGIKGANSANFLHLEALVFEKKRDFKKALELLKEGTLVSTDSSHISFLKGEIERVKEKNQQFKEVNYEFVE